MVLENQQRLNHWLVWLIQRMVRFCGWQGHQQLIGWKSRRKLVCSWFCWFVYVWQQIILGIGWNFLWYESFRLWGETFNGSTGIIWFYSSSLWSYWMFSHGMRQKVFVIGALSIQISGVGWAFNWFGSAGGFLTLTNDARAWHADKGILFCSQPMF